MAILSGLSARERALIAVAALLIAGAAGYRLWWQPLAAERDALRTRIETLDRALARARIVGIDRAAPETIRAPATQRVTESAALHGVIIRRLEPEGRRVRLALGETGFEALMRWLAELEAAHGLLVTAAEIDRRPAPGIVTARLVLAPTGAETE